MGPYIRYRWSWPNIQTMANQKIGRWNRDFHTVRGGINPDDIDVRPWVVGAVDVWVNSDPGMWPYRTRVTPKLCMNPGQWGIKQKWLAYISSTITRVWNSKLWMSYAPCSRAVSTRSERYTMLATSSSIAKAFEELTDGGSPTTVFSTWNNTSARLSTIRQHIDDRSGRLGSRWY